MSILKILKEFKTNKPTVVNNLTGRFLKNGSNIHCTPTTKICNLSIKLTFSVDKYKVAKIKSLYEKGLKNELNSIRLISLLPLVSKVIELIIHDQIMNCLSDNN